MVLESLGRKTEAASIYQRLISENSLGETHCLQIAKTFISLKRWEAAEHAIHLALKHSPANAKHYFSLSETFRYRSKWRQEIDSLREAVKLDGGKSAWWKRLGDLHFQMEEFDDAKQAYVKAIDLEKDDPDSYFQYARTVEQCGEEENAKTAYDTAVALDRQNNAKQLGLGILFQKSGAWDRAAAEYERLTRLKPFDADIQYHAGFAHERCRNWNKAIEFYQRAVSQEKDNAEWHYRLGLSLERSGKYKDAVDAYTCAIKIRGKGKVGYWHYRAGHTLTQSALLGDAIGHFLNMGYAPDEDRLLRAAQDRLSEVDAPKPTILSRTVYESDLNTRYTALCRAVLAADYSNAQLHYRLANALEREERWSEAAKAYEAAIDRSNEHNPNWYFRLGLTHVCQDNLEKACAAFKATRKIQNGYGIDTRAYEKSVSSWQYMVYNEYRVDLPVRSNVILYESNLGGTVSCNPWAIFKFIFDAEPFANFIHVWAVEPDAFIPPKLRLNPNIVIVTRDSDLYLRYLASAKYLINNSTFPAYFLRRDEQQYLNTWHGTPLKTLGKDINGEVEFMARRNTARNFLQATHIISPNPHTTRVLIDRYDVASACEANIAETGYPRSDALFNRSKQSNADMRARLGIDADKPVVLYAPTWRGTMNNVDAEADRILEDLKALRKCGHQIVFRGHHYAERHLQDKELTDIIVPRDLDTYDVLGIVDVLITDYSSVFFDFLPLSRPIIFYAYDMDEYVAQRGQFYLSKEEFPGVVCSTIAECSTALDSFRKGGFTPDEKYRAALARFCPHDDGSSTKRVVEFFFNGSEAGRITRYGRYSGRSTVLFFGGHFTPNGITVSFENLLRAIDKNKYDVTVAADPEQISRQEDCRKHYLALEREFQFLGRAGQMLVTPEERWMRDVYEQNHRFFSEQHREIYFHAFNREFERMFGKHLWDAVIAFEGYGPFWTSLFAASGSFARTRAVYLHNDMMEERRLRFPQLDAVMNLYQHFDSVVSVSPIMQGVNEKKVGVRYKVDPQRFNSSPNIIDCDAIRSKAKEPVDDDLAQFIGSFKLFVTIGRLSPEKDHRKLILAFSRVAAREGACLVILGDGILRPDLSRLISELGLEKHILLAGQRANPFPLLRRADCFVLSSNHEGQPMVLLEALALGKCIIATDIPGNRGALEGNEGCLFHNSVEGLVEGLEKFLARDLEPPRFDWDTYVSRALAQFADVVDSR